MSIRTVDVIGIIYPEYHPVGDYHAKTSASRGLQRARGSEHTERW
ncbi:hypothetical protein AG1IA_04266 [Rhizoctonia solani AG-1 IA]|uniref:Uncharacterized protein n=1 Tax=Thanatephorus cucumeris (strain AG1-IA) TaxID=983506 RepID=L8WZB3_THACA|nr:hypothetical protein AG1IA_04266 [Rhizoctonia solani AG-1 IA]